MTTLLGPPLDTDLLLDLWVAGDPAPQGSKRAFRNKHSGKIQQVESSKRVAPWREDIRQAVLAETVTRSLVTAEPLAVELDFRLRRPVAHHISANRARPVRANAPTHPAGKPDVDKLARAVLDAIGSAGTVWVDDSQVVTLTAAKRYAINNTTGVDIRVRRAIP